MASGEARAARDRDNTYHDRKCKLAHLTGHLPQELWNTFLVAVLARGEACSERAVIGSLLLGFLVRDLFTLHVADPLDPHGQPVYTYIPVSQAAIPDLNAAVAARLAAHTDLRARLEAVPRYHSDTNMVDHVGKQLETACSNMLTLLFAGRLKKSVVPDGADGTWYLMGTEEHQRRFGFRGLGGASVVLAALHLSMQAELALQRGLLWLEGGQVTDDWLEDPANRIRLLRHAVHTTREMKAAMAAWQLDMVPWQQPELISHGLLPRVPRPPAPYALTPTSECQARHVFIDTRGLYGVVRDAGMLGLVTEEGVTSLTKLRNGALPDPGKPGKHIEGPKDSQVADRWDALLPDPRRQKLESPKHSFAQVVYTDGVDISVMFLRPKPVAPPAELPRMGIHMGAVNPLAHLDAEWLGVDPGETTWPPWRTRSAALPAQQCPTYRESGITRQAQMTKTWLAQVKPQLKALSRVSSRPSSLASYWRFADTVLATYLIKQAQKRWPDVILALAYGAACFNGSGTIGCRGVSVSQMLKEALRWLWPVYSEAKRSQVRGLLYSTSNNIRFYARDVSGVLNIRRCAVGPGSRPTELCGWEGLPAKAGPARPGVGVPARQGPVAQVAAQVAAVASYSKIIQHYKILNLSS
ncbi:hypothetical protein QJQ45_004146 [Haematococcus lacustris]|nr:hypothetical protein QJQ45_004149 [Haematococcus lacustris]KAJ9517797.1 hypothetical protein QJQ45_004146 [Haematococcus lacustris]